MDGKVYNYVIGAILILVPLAVYHISLGPINISLDRLILILFFPFWGYILLTTSWSRKIIFFTLSLPILAFVSALANDSIDISQFVNYVPSWIISVLLFALAFHFTVDNSHKKPIHRIIEVHGWLIIFFAGYISFHTILLRNYSFNLPFGQWLGGLMEDPHKLSMLRNNRLFFPFSSSPRLGFIAGFISLFFFFKPGTNFRHLTVALLTFVVLVLTFSRGAILSFILTVFFSMIMIILKYQSERYQLKRIFIISVLGIVIVSVFFSLSDTVPQLKTDRLLLLSFDDPSAEGHLGVRIRVLATMLESDIVNFLFGYGPGNTRRVLSVSSAHSSYFTVLIEQGFVGFLFFIFAWGSLLILLTFARNHGIGGKNGLFLHVLSFHLFIVHMFYEASTLTLLWIYLGFTYGLVFPKQTKINQ